MQPTACQHNLQLPGAFDSEVNARLLNHDGYEVFGLHGMAHSLATRSETFSKLCLAVVILSSSQVACHDNGTVRHCAYNLALGRSACAF